MQSTDENGFGQLPAASVIEGWCLMIHIYAHMMIIMHAEFAYEVCVCDTVCAFTYMMMLSMCAMVSVYTSAYVLCVLSLLYAVLC